MPNDPIQVPFQDVYAVAYKTGAVPTWSGAGEAVAALDGIEPDSPGFALLPGVEYQPNPAILGRAGQRPATRTNFNPPKVTFNHALRFEGMINLLLAMFYGTEATADIVDGTDTVGKQHTFTMHDTLINVNGTIAKRGKTFDGTARFA